MNQQGSNEASNPPHSSVVVETFSGRAQDFHERDIPEGSPVRLWWFETTSDALVLGSTQDPRVVDVDACRSQGVDLVKRRSGGGLVLVSRSGTLWLDVVVPADHPLWERDVTTSSFWLGEVWITALRDVGVTSLTQHRAGLLRTEVSDLICFAGRGPGEVFDADGAKVVGISQRRTRGHARFQCAVSLEWEPMRLVEFLDQEPRGMVMARWSEIEGAGSSIDLDRRMLMQAMTARLLERLDSSGA